MRDDGAEKKTFHRGEQQNVKLTVWDSLFSIFRDGEAGKAEFTFRQRLLNVYGGDAGSVKGGNKE